jgi:hypothetical protein
MHAAKQFACLFRCCAVYPGVSPGLSEVSKATAVPILHIHHFPDHK